MKSLGISLFELLADMWTEVDCAVSVGLEVDADVEKLGSLMQMFDARLHTGHIVLSLQNGI